MSVLVLVLLMLLVVVKVAVEVAVGIAVKGVLYMLCVWLVVYVYRLLFADGCSGGGCGDDNDGSDFS